MCTTIPTPVYTMTRVPTWTVPSRTRHGKDHTVTQITESGELQCSCEAGMYGKQCWHRLFVKDGHAGKPRVRLTIPATTPLRARVSAEGAAYAASLEV